LKDNCIMSLTYSLLVLTILALKAVAFSPSPLSLICSKSPSINTNYSRQFSLSSVNDDANVIVMNRRNFITAGLVSQILWTPLLQPAAADEGDLTSQMFNEDGSLKAVLNGKSQSDLEAKSRKIVINFPTEINDKAIVSADGRKVSAGENEGKFLKVTYDVPEKWTDAPDYIDTLLASGEKACDRIVVYQVPGIFKDFTKLDAATTIGVAKALSVDSLESGVLPSTLKSADVVSGRKATKDCGNTGDQCKYYEFDLAMAPDNCDPKGAENLGLGFCPYNTIVLLSATIVAERMLVFAVTCTKDEWKRSNADLKRVRSSFTVEF